MEENQKTFLNALESEALAQIDELKKHRTYQGTNAEYGQRAKIALGVIGNYVRLRGTMANEETNALVRHRLLGPDSDAQKLLRGGPDHDA
jgi:hypothetical protein